MPGTRNPNNSSGSSAPTNPNRKATKSTYIYPYWNSDIVAAVRPYIQNLKFRRNFSSRDAKDEYGTNVMGRFICTNSACSNDGWSSKVVAIVIRGYEDNEYNAVVYNQRCEQCEHLGDLFLDKTCYVERVSYRLKKWAGVQMEQPFYVEKTTPPHQSDLCEGCKQGVCRAGRAFN